MRYGGGDFIGGMASRRAHVLTVLLLGRDRRSDGRARRRGAVAGEPAVSQRVASRPEANEAGHQGPVQQDQRGGERGGWTIIPTTIIGLRPIVSASRPLVVRFTG